MDVTQRPHVSVLDPIGPAVTRVGEILFKPFDLSKWFVIGFCAWLAGLAGGGGGGGNYNFSGAQETELNQAKELIIQNLPWIIPVAIVGVLIFLAIAVIVTWLSSRGHFMFLHCVVENKAEVKIPWHKFQKRGNSLFLFRLVVGIVSFICIAVLVGLIIILSFLCAEGSPPMTAPLIISFVCLFLLLIIIAVSAAIIMKFTKDFVVPIMFLGTERCVGGWQKLLEILCVNKARFALYILFQIVIGMAVGGIILTLALFTCGCACCFMAIPYIGTVLLLPLHIFYRAYSLMYLKQYGPRFDVFAAAQPPVIEGIPPAN